MTKLWALEGKGNSPSFLFSLIESVFRDDVGQHGADDGPGGRRRKFTGMKGVFKDGRFVDDDEPPQMRNIEYDLSPERMEKLWVGG